MMKISISVEDLEKQLICQLSSFFLVDNEKVRLINNKMEKVLARCEYCFMKTDNKYYSLKGEVYFNPYQSAQYTVFLYFFSNTIWYDTENRFLADELYYLNKIMNGCDLFYEVKLPDYFLLDHPVGSVMGRAEYGEGIIFAQNCTVGNNRGIYPVLGKNVRLCAYSSVIGNCHIGDNVILGAHAAVKDEDVPDNCLVFGELPNLVLKIRK